MRHAHHRQIGRDAAHDDTAVQVSRRILTHSTMAIFCWRRVYARALIRQQRTALSLSLSRFLSFQLIIVVTVFVVFVSTTATSDVPHFMKFTSDEQLNGSDLRLSGWLLNAAKLNDAMTAESQLFFFPIQNLSGWRVSAIYLGLFAVIGMWFCTRLPNFIRNRPATELWHHNDIIRWQP